MSCETAANKDDGECGSGRSETVASEGEQSRHYPGQSIGNCESSSSSEDEAGFASPPPNKRRKYKHISPDPRIDGLINQFSYLTQLSQSSPGLTLSVPNSNINQDSQSPYLINPCCSTDRFHLGEINTEFDEKRVIPSANKGRRDRVNQLQHFETQAWKGIRYKSTLRGFSATPGFVCLKTNEEFCHLNKTKDYLASAENLLAGLTNAELDQQELLNQALQDLLNWSAKNPGELNPNSLFEKIMGLLGPGSPLHKCSEKIMQIICGRRGECIEIRRERIIKEISNPNLKATLRAIPPSSEYLFSRDTLHPVIKSLGGTQTWLNKPDYIKERKNSRYPSNYKQEKRSHSLSDNKPTRSDQKLKQDNFQGPQKRHNFRKFHSKKNNADQNPKQK
ncbi:hypothetical protein O3G_MSEX001918 [Manduca sexta]|uniref:Uncharacterized protein n=1 Tax=Manduca sexta TaxID=7130 RepID=A0A921YLP5_MANSE|nr:hypothetical protein O3G_MSEX001918 [Manduca sexta]